MSGLSVLVLIFVLLPLVLLCVPITFIVKGRLCSEEQWVKVRVAWGLGLFSATIGINGREKSFGLQLAGITIPVSGKKSARKIRGGKTGFNPSKLITLFNKKLLTVVLGYLIKVLRSFRLRLQLRGIYGTDDPALTGMLVWLIAELSAKHYNLELEADFSRPIINLNGETSGRVVPILILCLTISLLLAKQIRELWWVNIKKRFIKNKSKEATQNV